MYVISEKLVIAPDYYHGFTLVFSGRTGVIKRFHNSFWKKLTYEQRWGGYIKKRPELDPLIKSKFLVPKDEDEKTETIRDNIYLVGSSRKLSWLIMSSADCNLACVYCGQEHSCIKLSHKKCDLIVNKLRKTLETNNYTGLHIGWFGGEPLLGLDIIRCLTPQFLEICELLNMTYQAKLLTNGVLLTDEIGQELVDEHSIKNIEVTIDGPQKVHNSRKIAKGGLNVYDTVVKNLRRFLSDKTSDQILLNIRCNVDSHNIAFAKELVDEIVNWNLVKQPNLFFTPTHTWGKAQGQSFAFDMKNYAKHEIELLEYTLGKGFPLSILPSSEGGGCINILSNANVVIAPDGRLYKCTEIPLVPIYKHEESNIQWWDMGVITDEAGLCKGATQNKSTWYQEILDGKWPCGDCNLLGICKEVCPKRWREGLSGCPPYKYNIADRMRLFSRKKMALGLDESYDNGKNLFNRIGKLIGIKK